MTKRLFFLILLIVFNVFYLQGQNKVIRFYDKIVPGSESWNWIEQDMIMGKAKFMFNVVSPTLTVFEAYSSKATGQAVIICFSGRFHVLAMSGEGYDVANWLSEKGITAFVLKYGLAHI